MPDRTEAAGARRTGHTVKEFDRELGELSAMVVTMGCKVLEQFGHAVKALQERDPAEVRIAREADDEIDDLEVRIDTEMLRLLALRNPMALDLRAIVAASRIATDLERIGDYAGSLAKTSLRLDSPDLDVYRPLLARMAEEARVMLAQILEAMVSENAELAVRVWHHDDILDDLHDELIEMLTASLGKSSGAVMPHSSLIYAARALERIGDHVTNIAEHIYFHVHGEKYRGR